MRAALLTAACAGCIPRLYTKGGDEPPSDWVTPTNGWEIATPPADLGGEGYDEGDVVPDFRLVDQHGDEVSLWQFYGDVILLDVSTIWCEPCKDLAAHTEETVDAHEAEGFVYLTVLQEDVDSNPPDVEDLNLWADTFGITAPVLADGDKLGISEAITQYPQVMTIGRTMRIHERLEVPDDAHVRDAILDLLALDRKAPAAEAPRGCDR